MNKKILRAVVPAVVMLMVLAGSVMAHDLFLKPENFFVKPNSTVDVRILNGTFTSSEAALKRERLQNSALVGGQGTAALEKSSWDTAGKWTRWTIQTGSEGTYLLSASLLPRTIRLKGEDFNSYLKEDGLPDVLAARKSHGELGDSAYERYSKHVKTLIQVGSKRTTKLDSVFGYPAELVPLDNPYKLHAGETMHVRAVVDGRAVANQYVLAGGTTASGARISEQGVRTNKDGVAHIALRRSGVWYVKFISMKRIDQAAKDSVDYESKWATLTFAIR